MDATFMRFNLNLCLLALLLLGSSSVLAIEAAAQQPASQAAANTKAEQAKPKKTAQELQLELDMLKRTAADAIQIANERTKLRKEVADLSFTVENLRLKNLEISNQNSHYWFLSGAGVILLGVVIGLILPHLSLRRKRSSWDSF
jgi:SH3 domain protein